MTLDRVSLFRMVAVHCSNPPRQKPLEGSMTFLLIAFIVPFPPYRLSPLLLTADACVIVALGSVS